MSRLRRHVVTIATALACTSILAGCSAIAGVDQTRIEHHTFQVGSAAQLQLSTYNGSVTVTAGDDGPVDVTTTIHGRAGVQDAAASIAASVQVDYTQNGSVVSVTVEQPKYQPPQTSSGADVDVTLPRGSSVAVMDSNGRVSVVNVTGSITVKTSNGAVVTREGNGLDLETSNGSVTATDPAGPLTVKTSNGAVTINSANQVTASVESTNGALTFDGSLATGSHSFTTSNAAVSLALPSDQAFTIDARTSNGSVSTDFPLTTTSDSLTGTVGSGSASIKVRTSNGALSVKKLAP